MNRIKNHLLGNGNMSHPRRCRSISGMAIAVMISIAAMAYSPFASAALYPIAKRETATGSGVYEFYLNNGTTNPSFRPQGFSFYDKWINTGEDSDPLKYLDPSDPLYNWWDYENNDAPYYHRDARYTDILYPGVYDDSEFRDELETMANAGYNTVRIFFGHYAHRDDTAPGGAPKLYDEYIWNTVYALKAAQDKGMHVILGFGFIPETYESEMPPSGAPPDLTPDDTTTTAHNFNYYFLYPDAVQTMADYITDVLHWVKYRADNLYYTNLLNTVMAIDLMNESYFFTDRPPFNLSGEVTFSQLSPEDYDMDDEDERVALMDNAFKYWLETVTDAIKAKDYGAFADILLTANVVTPYSQGMTDYTYINRAVPPRVKNMLPAESQIDYIDIHLYPTNPEGSENYGYSIDDDLATAEIEKAGARKSKLTDNTAINKPMLMSEYGAVKTDGDKEHYPTLSRAIDCLVMHQHHSFDYGFSGWLLWAWRDLRDEYDNGYWNAMVDGAGAIKNLLGQYADPGQRKMFVLTGESGRNLMWVDDQGNMVIRAGRRVSSYTQPAGAKPYCVKNSSDDNVLETNMSQGTDWNLMMVDGSSNVTTHSACATPASPLILFKNSSAANVFTLDAAGVINIAGDFYDIDSN